MKELLKKSVRERAFAVIKNIFSCFKLRLVTTHHNPKTPFYRTLTKLKYDTKHIKNKNKYKPKKKKTTNIKN